jgi:hypothetical protein
MALTRCSECSREISDKAAACPGCGAPVTKAAPTPPPPKSIGQKNVGCGTVVIVFVVLGVIFLAILGKINPEDPAVREERQRAALAIEICWKDYEKKSLDPGTKRFVASVCEKMEGDFRKKYRRDP